MSSIYRCLLAALCVATFVSSPSSAQNEAESIFFFDKPFMTVEEARVISKHSKVIVDVENCANNLELLQLIKSTNPKIELVADISLTRLRSPFGQSFRPIQSYFMGIMKKLDKDFWLRDAAGEAVYDPREGGWRIFNVSAIDSLNRQGAGYIKLAASFYSCVLSDYGIWDAFRVNPSWQDPMSSEFVSSNTYAIDPQDEKSFQIDSDGDGKGDDPFMFIPAWKKGVKDFILLMGEGNKKFVALTE